MVTDGQMATDGAFSLILWVARNVCASGGAATRKPSVWPRVAEERGSTLVEFALVAPLLLTFLLGIFWMGRAYNVYQTITRAAREGARYAVLPSCAAAGVAGCGNVYLDTYSNNDCLQNPTNIFTGFVSPALSASSLDPSKVQQYCQEAEWLNPNGDPNTDAKMPQQCGVVIRFWYPVPLAIPFTSLSATTINIPTRVQMRMENVPINGTTGAPACP